MGSRSGQDGGGEKESRRTHALGRHAQSHHRIRSAHLTIDSVEYRRKGKFLTRLVLEWIEMI